MKTKVRTVFLTFMLLIITISVEKATAQEDLPWFMEQHGNNGDQSPQGAPLTGGTDVMILLGIAYAAKKISDMKRKDRISR
jgi:hypothetical protein